MVGHFTAEERIKTRSSGNIYSCYDTWELKPYYLTSRLQAKINENKTNAYRHGLFKRAFNHYVTVCQFGSIAI